MDSKREPKQAQEEEQDAPLRGTITDPEFRQKRARAGGYARNSIDTYIRSLVARAPELTPEQIDRLRALLPSSAAEPEQRAAS